MKRNAVICLLILALTLGFAGCSSRAPEHEKEIIPAVLSGASGVRAGVSDAAAGTPAVQTDVSGADAFATDGNAQAVSPAADLSFAGDVSAQAVSPAVGKSYAGDGWEGNWYGWWHAENCTGKYAETWENARFDICAEIRGGWMFLWDQYSPRDDALAEFMFDAGGSTGSASNGMGYYMDMITLGGELTFTREGELLRFRGRYKTDNGSFDFDGLLKPWGTVWDGVPADELPTVYQDWYLPLIQSGMSEPPSSFTEA